MTRFARGDGVLVEALGYLWVAFSPASGESVLLNDEAASILEVLESGTASTASICATLSDDSGIDAHALFDIVEACWPRLVGAGLVRRLCPVQAMQR
jgi:PqqD family protein of HPr-rel-A system